MKNPSREAVRRYCIANDLFTGGNGNQYERMMTMLDRQMPIHDIATVIWVCSPLGGKHADEIENDLKAIMIEEGSEDDADQGGLQPAT